VKEIGKKSTNFSIGVIYQKWGILIILFVEILIFALLSEQFFTLNNLMVVGRQVSFIGVAAVGGTMLMLTGGIDISTGAMLALSGTLCAMMTVNAGIPLFAAILITIAVGIAGGFISGIGFTQFSITPLIGTLAMQSMLKGIAHIITGAAPIYGLSASYKMIAQGYIGGVFPVPLLIMIIVFILGYWLLHHTYIGRYIYAVGGNAEAARLSGINIKAIYLLCFIASAACSALAGILMSARLGSGQPSIGADFPMDVITAIVLGGVSINGGSGKIGGVLVGVLIMGILGNGMIMIGMSEFWQWFIKGVVLFFAVAMSNLYARKAV
jgi:ribose/xylose/arabinose/galactoside ABC-type transport system permease subunit